MLGVSPYDAADLLATFIKAAVEGLKYHADFVAERVSCQAVEDECGLEENVEIGSNSGGEER